MASKSIIYKSLKTHEDFEACERLQKETWGFHDVSVVPRHMLLHFEKYGGIVLGAFDGDQLIGFVYGFLGLYEGQLKHTSVMTAVQPEYRNRGVAFQLKHEQRKLALDQGLSLMTWTFDPLQSPNAHFNLKKLGAICRGYERNLYGEFRDEINKGLPTDRLAMEWWIDSGRTQQRMDKGFVREKTRSSPHNPPRIGNDGIVEPSQQTVDVSTINQLHLAIPIDIDDLKNQRAELALKWRYHIREWFETAFADGFILHDFLLDRDQGIGIYTLSRTDLESLLQGGS